MKNTITKDFIAYDFLSIDTNTDQEQLIVDCYQKFGWEYLESIGSNYRNEDYFINNLDLYENRLIKVKFRRNRKIKNKLELINLQKKMEASFKKIEQLKKEPETFSTICSISIGVVGLAFFVFAMLSYFRNNPIYILTIFNGIIGIIGFILGYFMNSKLFEQKREQNELLIEQQYDIIYECCEKATKLIG